MFDGPFTLTAAVARLFVALAAVTAAAAPVAAGAAGAVATTTAGCGPTAPPDTPIPEPGAAARAGEGTADAPAIRSVYPNPVRDGDRGEFVVVELPAPGNWTLADDETRVRLPANVSGRVVLSAAPSAVPPSVAGPTVRLAEMPALSNAGETLRLAHNGTVVDRVTYEGAPAGERYRSAEGFEPLGATDFAVNGTGDADVTAFVIPDAPDVVREVLRSADRRVLLAGYTLTSERVVSALLAAADRGIRVRVLLEGGPVGGISSREARLLDRLVRAGVEVQVVAGPRARYVYHHAKYAVVDDSAVVLSENWKPAGTGGGSSRGWGVVVDDRAVAAHLAAVFRADAGWRDARPWNAHRRNETFVEPDVTDGDYPARFDPAQVRADGVDVLVAPDNAEAAVLSLLDSACEDVLIQQMRIGGRQTPFLRAAIDAARRGVEVRILLSSAWYVADHNRRLAAWLNDLADREGLALSAKLATPEGRYGKIHTKGVVVDGRRVLVGSLNWNRHAARENREVAVILSGQTVAGYYADVFRADWRSGNRRAPIGLLLIAVLAAVLAARWAIDRIEFDEPADPVDVSLRGPRTATGSRGPRRVRPPPSSRRERRAPPRGAPRRT